MDIYQIFYYGFIASGALMSAGTGYFLGKRKGFSCVEALKIVCLSLMTGIFAAFLMGKLQTFIISFTQLPNYNNRLRIFGGLLFGPLFVYLPIKYIKWDFDKVADMLAPGTYLLLGLSKLGCAAYGCCYGIEWKYGIASRFTDCKVFPVQILESVLCIILFIVIFAVVIKEKHRKGTVYGLTLILYGVMRFFVEYLREYTPAEKTYFMGMNFWQVFSVISVVTGAVWFIGKYRANNPDSQSMTMQCEE